MGAILRSLWRLPELVHAQRRLEDDAAGLRADLQRTDDTAQSFEARTKSAFEAASHRIAQVREELGRAVELRAERRELDTATNRLISLINARLTRDDIAALEQSLAGARGELDAARAAAQAVLDASLREIERLLARTLAELRNETASLRGDVLNQEKVTADALERLGNPARAAPAGGARAAPAQNDHQLDAMYAKFEDQFRGAHDEIRQRVGIYLPFVRDAGAGTRAAPVLDLGCGRGEWLELLRDEGLAARGVDLNRIFLDHCRGLQLEVHEDDALGYLRGLEADSLGAITAIHLIEHLPFNDLVALVDEARRVLKPGGVVIFETPNPRNVLVATCNFYFDPTHRNPLPPDLTQFLLTARGFANAGVRELHPYGEENLLTSGEPQVVSTLNRILYSAQDYCVFGYKPARAER